MAQRLSSGALQCSTCHNQHSDIYAGSQHVSIDPNALTTLTVTSGAPVKGYCIEIVSPSNGTTTATFKLSNERCSLNVLTWYGWNGSSWVSYNGNARTAAASVALNDAYATVSFKNAGKDVGFSPAGLQIYLFNGSTFLRHNNTDSAICTVCHKTRKNTLNDVETYTAGVKKHHPVGVTLNSGTRTYDRTSIFDADGSTNDSINSNNLVLGPTNMVGCMTCHHPHNAESNSLISEPR